MGTTIVDVRSPEEYDNGHVNGSVNIPLYEIPGRVEEIKSMPYPVVLCCASGNRSRQATMFLSGHGINCENGGSWVEVKNKYQSK